MKKNLIIVESPAKAKTIEKFLGSDFKVIASYGHIKDLPKSKMGIDIENNFKPEYIIPTKARKNLNLLKKEAQKAKNIYLATDPDREGEAISWHIADELNYLNKETKRIAFYEITKEAIRESLESPRGLNKDLFNAQQARRVLDRLVGYNLSPFLWKKVRKGLSAGRVQSVAVRIIVDREREIEKFKPEEYWEIQAKLKKDKLDYLANLLKIDGKKAVIGNKKEAEKVERELKNQSFQISKIDKKQTKKSPAPPFITSTLQQAAANKLNFSAKKTMMIAQQLYEGIEIENSTHGLITYMRTDSLNLSEKFINESKKYIEKEFGERYLPKGQRKYKKSKSAQEAHEAIRPTYVNYHPRKISKFLNKDQYRLYNLIFKRTMASLMADTTYKNIRAEITAGKYLFSLNAKEVDFEGFIALYEEKEEKAKKAIKIEELEKLKKNDKLKLENIISEQKFTQPPPRLNEASLVKTLEENGVGRPSTYAPIISTIQERNYVSLENKKFYPEKFGLIVTDLLVEHFPFVVSIDFTAQMEKDLDNVALGEKKWRRVVSRFWEPFYKNLKKKEEEVEKVKIPDKKTDEICDKCGAKMVIKTGRYGEFLACSNFPDCKNTKPIIKKIDMPCPDCDNGEIIERKTKRGRIFWGCSNYPSCKFATWKNPAEKKQD